MKKPEKLKVCNWCLMVITVLMVVSSIHVEMLAGSSQFWIWAHVFLGLLFFGFIFRHLYLHFKWRNWGKVLWRQKSANTRWMTAIGILTLLTAFVATVGWVISPDHSAVGAIHGKLGFIFIVLAFWHIFRRIRYYSR